MFNLDDSVKNWLMMFRKHAAFGHGSVREMEIHLRDHIDDLLSEGMEEKDAFEKAVKEFGEINPMAQEEFSNIKTRSKYFDFIDSTLLYNYFKSAIRNFRKHKFFAFINLIGLTMGLSMVLLIGLFVLDELRYDQFHTKKESLFRVVENQYYEGQDVFPVAVTPTGLGPSLMKDFPEVLAFTRVSNENYLFELGEKKILETGGMMVDEHFFSMFSFPLVKGDLASFNEHLNGLLLTEKLAEKYFPNVNPVGKSIKLSEEDYIIYGVLKDVPLNSHLPFTYLVNFKKYLAENPEEANAFGSNWLYTYVELDSKADLQRVNEKVKGQIEANNEGSVTEIYLQPLLDIYLGEVDFVVEVQNKGEMLYVKTFSIAAIFILLISCINFMNLSTARSSNRAKEVGLRKTIGAGRGQLIFQFLSESVLLSIIALVLSIILVAFFLPFFNQLANKEIDLQILLDPRLGSLLVIGLFGVAILTGLVAGSYPAIYLSSIKPIKALNTQVITVKQRFGLRRILVVLQFVISVVLIIGTTVIYQQLQYIQDVDLGYNRQNLIYAFASSKNSKALADELKKQPGVVNVGLSDHHPAYVLSSSSGFGWPGKNPEETILLHYMGIDEHYMPTMEMKVTKGRAFVHTDTAVVIINQRALEIMGLDDPVGKKMTGFGEEDIPYRIVGVVENFNFKSIHTVIEPLVIYKDSDLGRIFIKYETSEKENIVYTLEKVWQEFYPDREFDYYFLDDDFDEIYEAEERTSKLSTYFSGFAILISCLGLFGLVSYATEQRIKEIGIRKVFGASINNLFFLQTFDFIRLVFVSLLFSIPIGWYVMGEWLANYAYRVNLSLWVFVGSAFAAIIIAILTVSYQTIRASIRNPVNAIRNI